jgi:predicted transposase YdaD
LLVINQQEKEKIMQSVMQQGKLAIAKNMVNKGADITFIQDVTGLSKETIETLQQE